MMPVIHTTSATPLELIKIERSQGPGAHVWLRRNITETTSEVDGSPIWEADEIYLWRDEAPTIADVERDFDALWAAAARDGDTAAVWRADVEAALAELADLVTGGL